MGTLGCVPAYDRYFVKGIRSQKIASGTYNIKSILQLVIFYENNIEQLDSVPLKFIVADMLYPQMKILDMGFWQIGFDLDNKEVRQIEAIIKSMTMAERTNPNILNGSRRKRIAAGSGTTVQRVNQLIKQFEDARKFMKQMQSMSKGKKGMFPKLPFMG